ncbi:DNA-directed DNA polymerase [Tanacetum coccineum]
MFFRTLSLEELRSPGFNLFSELEYSEEEEEEEEEPMAETMEQYMSKTRAHYGSRVVRPKIEENNSFELKGQFLKKLKSNTFSGSDHEYANEHIKKVLEIVDLFHISNIIVDQVMLRAFPMSLTRAEVVLFYNGLDVPTRQILDSRGAIPSMAVADAKKAIQEMKVNKKVYDAQVGCEQCKGHHYTKDCPLKEWGKTLEEAYYTNNANPSFQEWRQSIEDTLSKFMGESAKRHEEHSNLIKEIRASTDAAIRNQGASIKTLEIQIGQMSKVLHEGGFRSLPSSTKTNPRDQVKLIPTTTNADESSIHHIESRQYAVSTEQNNTLKYKSRQATLPFLDKTVKYSNGIAENVLVRIGKFTSLVDFIILDMPKDVKVPLILGRPFLSTARAKIDIYKRKITLRVGEEKIIYKSVSQSLDPISGDFIELNDLNKPLELRRNQGDDLIPTIEEVLEDTDDYRNEEMGDVIFGEPFLNEVGINARRFDGMITIHNGNDKVT